MPTDLGLKAMNTIHRGMLMISGGRLGWRLQRMPVVELTTTGRKSGRPRTVMLTSPLQDEETVVVVASRGGDDRSPAWFLNLQANPEVTVSLEGGAKQRMLARPATAEERAQLWPKVVADHKNYAAYQTKTSRVIPLVLLVPEGTSRNRDWRPAD